MLKQTPLNGKPAGSALRSDTNRVFSAVWGLLFSGFLRAVARIFSYTRLRTGIIAALLLLTLIAGWGLHQGVPAYASSVTPANTLNFQARLQMSNGSIAADGAYNIRFRLYDASQAGNLLWTETYLVSAGDGLETTNGYFSADLGSVAPFGSNINWGQQLYLTMEVGGTNSTPAWDGEMDPRLNLTSVPSAFALNNYNSGTGYTSSLRLGAPTSGDQTFTVPDQGAAGDYTLLTQQAGDGRYIQGSTGGSPQSASIYVSGTIRSASVLQAPALDAATAAALDIGQTNATVINLDQNTVIASGKTLTINGSTFNASGQLGLGTTAPTRQLEVDVSNTTVNAMPVLIKQSGNGDSGIEYRAGTNDYFAGIDSTDGAFKISSSLAAQGSTVTEGYATQGAATDQNAMTTQATKMTSNVNGTVQSISAWLGYVGTDADVQVGLYADNGSGTAPGALLTTSSIATAKADSLNTFPVTPVSITNGTVYWIALSTHDADTYYGDTGGTTLYRTGDGYPMPTSFTANANSSSKLSFYATVTTPGGMTDEFGSQALFSLSNSGQLQLHNYLDSTTAFSVQNAADSSIFTVDTTNSTVSVDGSVAYRKGVDFATTGTSNDVDFGTGALFRLTGSSTQTITGIAAGTDGRIMTLVNAASQAATLANNSSSSSAANRIVTGTGSDLNIAAGASVSLVYDSGASLWRVVGTISGTVSGGSYITLQGTSPGTADSGNFNISGTGIAATLQAAAFDTAAAGALTIGGTNATSIALGHAGITTTLSGLSFQFSSTGTSTLSAGGTLSLTAAGSSKFTTTSGDMTLGTNAYTGQVIIQALGASGTVSIGDNTAPTITIGNGSNTTRTISIGHANTSTTGTVNIGSQGTVNIGSTGTATTTNTTNINTTTGATGTQTTNIGSSANVNNAVTIEAGNTGKIQIGNGTTAHNIQIGTNAAAAQTVTIGSTNASSTTTIQGSNVSITGSQSAGYASTIYNTDTGTDADGLLIKLGVANASRSSSNYFVGFASGDGTIAGKIQGSASAVAFTTNGADYAEYFKADPSNLPQPGELVTIDSGTANGVRPATAGDLITGVISTSPGFIGNGPICDEGDTNCDSDYAKSNVLVSLTGQVPIKTNDEGGLIHVGDPIGASSVPGIATRATNGNIIGYALTTPDANGLVQVVIDISNTDPTRDLQASGIVAQSLNLTSNAFITGNLNVSGNTVLASLTVTGDEAVTGNLTVSGLVNVTDIVVGGHLITAGNTPTVAVTGTIGDGGQIQISGNDTSGTITITTGQGTLAHPLTAGELATLTFARAYGTNPRIMVTGNDGASTAMGAFPSSVTSTGFGLSTNGTPAANTTYTFTYFTVQ